MNIIKKTVVLGLLIAGLSLSSASAAISFTGDEIRDPAGSYGYSAFVGDFYVEADCFVTDVNVTNIWPTDTTTYVYPDTSGWYRGHVGTGAYDKWTDRTSVDYGFIEGDVYEGYGNAVGTDFLPPQLTMTVGGLDAGKIYDVYLVYWAQATIWPTAAALSGQPMQTYNATNAEVQFHTYSTSYGCEVKLGQISGVDQVSVDLDNTGVGGNFRARFDGLAFLEVPEPATLVLLSLGGLGFLRRRK